MSEANVSAAQAPAQVERVPILAGLLTGDLSEMSKTHLAGTHCPACGETSLGHKDICPNCSSSDVKHMALNDHGTLWTYTVVRHRPPGNYKGPDPFQPFGLGLVELPDGLRVFAPVHCDINELKVGLKLVFSAYVRPEEDGKEVVAFTYKLVGEENV